MRQGKQAGSGIAAWIAQFVAETREAVRRSGVVEADLIELEAFKEGAKAYIWAMAGTAFSKDIASDRILAEDLNTARAAIESSLGKRAIMETRLTSAREQTARLPEPRRLLFAISAGGVGLFSIAFAPTVFSVLMSSVNDTPLAWSISFAIAAAIGFFLTLVLLQPRVDSTASERSTLVGFGLGFGFGLLRLAKAEGLEDWLIAIGLTVLESMAVMGLNQFAERHRQSVAVWRSSQAQGVALERAIADLKEQIHEQRTRYDGLGTELKQREADAFDVDRVADYVGWAVEAAYRAAVNANRRMLEGGSGFALPQRLQGLGELEQL